MDVDLREDNIDVAFGSERAGFVLRRGREVDRHYVETLFSQPDAVASFAVGDG